MSKTIVELLCYLEPIFCAVVLIALYRSRESKKFTAMTSLLWLRLVADLFCLSLIEIGGRGIDRNLAYNLYFYAYWISFAAESLLSLYVILNIFALAMAPLKGLRALGTLVFRWAAGISVALSMMISFTPHQTGAKYLVHAVSQLQQISCVITLCLLLFVGFAIRPLGLSFRSRVFGVAVGLGVSAGANLASATWLTANSNLYSLMNGVFCGVSLLSFVVWSVYFFLPEPKRRIIVLPTTSPFLRWNQISEVLGDEPGFVAIAGIPPEAFAPAELEIMFRASAKMQSVAENSSAIDPATLQTLIA